MVFTNKYTGALINKFPNFVNSNSFKEAVSLYSDSKNINACTIFTGLTDYVTDELMKKNVKIMQEELDIYSFIEEVRIKFSESSIGSEEFDFDNAACTCFLENLSNRASMGEIDYSRFIPYLGTKSKEYCRAWDEFTGVKSPGLWNE